MIALEVWHGIIDNGSIAVVGAVVGVIVMKHRHLTTPIPYYSFSFPVQLTVSSSLTQLSSSHG